MKKLAFFVFVLLSIGFVYAYDDYFCFKKLDNNEQIPSIVNSISGKLVCANGFCTCKLDSGEGYCLVCTNSSGWFSSYTSCNSDFCDETEDLNKILEMKAGMGFNDGSILTKNRLMISVNLTRKAKIDLIEDNEVKNLCMHCDVFQKIFFYSEGRHDLTIRARVSGQLREEKISFFVDTKKPRIMKVMPVSSSYSSGLFKVSYEEDNLNRVVLNYGLRGYYNSVELNNCGNGKSECEIEIDLSDYYDKKIDYWFSIYDIANNNANSSKYSIFVDNRKPVINDIKYSFDGYAYNVILNVSEDNFKKAMYCYDGKCNLFCSSLRNNVCNKKINKDINQIELIITDRAENSESRIVEF